MGIVYNNSIVTNGLVLCLDAANKRSHSGAGTIWTDLVSSNTASLVNGPTYDNQNGGNVVLDGTNDYIQILNSVTSQTLSPAVATFIIWIKPNKYNSSSSCSIISRGNYNTSGGFFIHLGESSNIAQVRATFSKSTTTSYQFETTSNINLRNWGVWSQIAVSVSDKINLYVDGILRDSINRTVSSIVYGNGTINTSGDTNLVLCSSLSYAPTLDQGVGWKPYNGSVSFFQMYNRVLSAAEILQNYNATRGRFEV